MHNLGPIRVGDSNPVRVMGILNTSPESFYKKSIKTTKQSITQAIKSMEKEGADIIDVGAMSTAPYLSTVISEKTEAQRIQNAIKIIQNISNLPISVDTCRASVAKIAMDMGVQIINDISGLKYDKKMIDVISNFEPSLIVCAFDKKTIRGNQVDATKKLIKESVALALRSGISKNKIVVDPAIGFFRKTGKGKFFTRINSDWLHRDLLILENLHLLKQGYPLLVSVSNKSFLGRLLDKKPHERIAGSLAAEVVAVLKGADIIRTHNVKQTKDAISLAQKITRTNKSL